MWITSYCRLLDDIALVNGEVAMRRDADSEDSWFKQIYKQYELGVPEILQNGYPVAGRLLWPRNWIKRQPILNGYMPIGMMKSRWYSRTPLRSAGTDGRFIQSTNKTRSTEPIAFRSIHYSTLYWEKSPF